ncbi:MAG TPA: hypothetical protein DER09_14425 [Prolixibacteraceae bacterium]|nr:hypothetical protein [Prolixibacteraceae bacterium]
MAEKEIALLQEQINKLHDKKFDLDAWKNSTLIYLERIFGKENSKSKMIAELAYDYSSWNLRDTAATGKTSEKDPVIMQAEEIIVATIAELKTFGLPKPEREKDKLLELLKDELTGKNIREIESLLRGNEPDRISKITEIIEATGKDKLVTIVTKILTD